MPLNNNRTIGTTDDAGGIVYSVAAGTVVDNVFVFQDGAGNKFRRVTDGVYRASWAGIFGAGDKTAALQAVLNNAGVNTVVFDAGQSVTINGTLTVPAGKTLKFEQGAKLTGSGFVNGGIIEASVHYQIFATTLIVNPARVAGNIFPVEWFGAKGDGATDDIVAIQTTVDTCVRNYDNFRKIYFSAKIYNISAPILAYNWGGASYAGFTVEFVGQSSFWNASQGTRLNLTNRNNFAIGIQLGKSVTVRGLYITGMFATPALTPQQFYNVDFDAYLDPLCWRGHYSPYSGIVIDPFSHGNIPADGGYPGNDAYGNALTTYYRGPGGVGGGSTAIFIEDVFIDRFYVGVCSAPSSYTRNAEITVLNRVQFGAMQLCVSSSHDQEKGCEIINCGCWGATHTIFASQAYGAGIPGQWSINNFNIAGRVNRLISHDSSGYFPSKISYVFSESMGRFGIFNSAIGGTVENCELGFALPAVETGAYYDNYIESSGVVFKNCNIRLYGTSYPVTIKGNSIFSNCTFEKLPYYGVEPYYLGAPVSPSFIDCTANGVPFGPSRDLVSVNNSFYLPAYGKYKLYNPGSLGTGYNETWEVDEPQAYFPLDVFGAKLVNIVAGVFSFVVNASETPNFSVGQLALYVDAGARYMPAGIITAINAGTNTITVSYANPNLVNGNYGLAVLQELTFAIPFMGDVVNNTNTITNVKIDGAYPAAYNVGRWIKCACFHPGLTGAYTPFVFVLSYDAPTNTYTVGATSYYTKTGEYFSIAKKSIDAQSANTGLPPNGTILHKGAKMKLIISGVKYSYTVRQTGFINAAAMGDTRQALWVMDEPFKQKTNVDTSIDIEAGAKVVDIMIDPVADLAALKIGITPGGNELYDATFVAAASQQVFSIAKYFKAGGTIYFTGITSQTDIIVFKS